MPLISNFIVIWFMDTFFIVTADNFIIFIHIVLFASCVRLFIATYYTFETLYNYQTLYFMVFGRPKILFELVSS